MMIAINLNADKEHVTYMKSDQKLSDQKLSVIVIKGPEIDVLDAEKLRNKQHNVEFVGDHDKVKFIIRS